jgi:hypothetical protein
MNDNAETEQDNTVQGMQERDRIYQDKGREKHAGGRGRGGIHPGRRAKHLRDD